MPLQDPVCIVVHAVLSVSLYSTCFPVCCSTPFAARGRAKVAHFLQRAGLSPCSPTTLAASALWLAGVMCDGSQWWLTVPSVCWLARRSD